MPKTNTLPFISLLLIATMTLAPVIAAFDDWNYDGGWTAGPDAGGWNDEGWPAGNDAGGWNDEGWPAGNDAGGWNDEGSSTGPGAGGWNDGGSSTGSSAGGTSGDTGSFDPGGPGDFDPGPGSFDPAPGGPSPGGPGGFPTNADARWKPLEDKTIYQASRQGTMIYENIFSQCTDPDDTFLRFEISSTSSHYELRFVDDDLRIYNLNARFTGTETVTLKCNNVPASFKLNIIPVPGTRTTPGTDSENDDELSIHIGAIRIPNAYETEAGDAVPVTISFKNNGDKKLENLKAAVVIQDLGIRASVGPLDLPVGKRATRTLYVQLPEDVQPGTYYVRITIDSGSVHRVVHRDIEVTE